uniref:Uncharacterized protein n=1 Tax=viral metagenome TaxID=1070528 RepID=A0A6M3M1W5_9ZZZZ
MGLHEGVTVRKQDLLQVLKWLRDLSLRAVKKKINPWAVRQGLILFLQSSTKTMLDHGVSLEEIQQFDRLVTEQPEEADE